MFFANVFIILLRILQRFVIFLFGLKESKRYILGAALICITILISIFYSPFIGKRISHKELIEMIQNKSIYHGIIRLRIDTVLKEGFVREVQETIKERDGRLRTVYTQPDRYFVGYIDKDYAILICDDYGEAQREYVGYLGSISSEVGGYRPTVLREYLPYMIVGNNNFLRIFLCIFSSLSMLISIPLLSIKRSLGIKEYWEQL